MANIPSSAPTSSSIVEQPAPTPTTRRFLYIRPESVVKMKSIMVDIGPHYTTATDHEIYKHQLAVLCAIYNSSLDQKYEELICGIVILMYHNGTIVFPTTSPPELETVEVVNMIGALSDTIITGIIKHWKAVFPLKGEVSNRVIERDTNRRRVISRLVLLDAQAALMALHHLQIEDQIRNQDERPSEDSSRDEARPISEG